MPPSDRAELLRHGVLIRRSLRSAVWVVCAEVCVILDSYYHVNDMLLRIEQEVYGNSPDPMFGEAHLGCDGR